MTIKLNHVLVPARDKVGSARFLADLLGLAVEAKSPGSPEGRFAVVRVGDTRLDFDDVEHVEPQHYAFLVEAQAFDAILGRVVAAGLAHSADPAHERQGEINHLEGGRGFYFHERNGHNIEIITRPAGALK